MAKQLPKDHIFEFGVAFKRVNKIYRRSIVQRDKARVVSRRLESFDTSFVNALLLQVAHIGCSFPRVPFRSIPYSILYTGFRFLTGSSEIGASADSLFLIWRIFLIFLLIVIAPTITRIGNTIRVNTSIILHQTVEIRHTIEILTADKQQIDSYLQASVCHNSIFFVLSVLLADFLKESLCFLRILANSTASCVGGGNKHISSQWVALACPISLSNT